MAKRGWTGVRTAGAVVAASAGLLVWWAWPSDTVAGVERRLAREVPVGTPRPEAEAWVGRQGVEWSYSQDFRHNSLFEQKGIDPGTYSGYVVALIRDTDRDLLVTGSIQFYILFDDRDRVAGHLVKWFGTGL